MKRRELETASIPIKENFADLGGTKKLSQNRMHYLMYGVGVLNEGTGEFVGKELVERERSKEDFKGVLRMVCEAGRCSF